MTITRTDATTTASGASITSLACNIPANTVAGRWLQMRVAVQRSSALPTINTPTGWTLDNDTGGTTVRQAIFHRVADGTEGASVTVGITGSSARICIDITPYDGTSIELDDIEVGTGASGTGLPTTAATATVANTRVIAHYSVGVGASNITPEGTLAEIADYGPGSSVRVATADKALASAGSTGTLNGTSSSGGESINHIVVLREGSAPAAGGGAMGLSRMWGV